MSFRKDINGLRAIAVLSVVTFHFFPTGLPGGFAGVDVFFVISGYLMTMIIVKNLDSGDFSVLGFYLARARRILPALVVLSVFLLIYGWFFLLPTDYKELSKHIATSLTFLSNVVYWRESGYFAAGAHEKWLLHTWSLSVEWQFYIVYPLVILFLKKLLGIAKLMPVIIIMAVFSFLLSLYMSFEHPEQAYFMFYTRAWQMLAGGLVFMLPSGLGNRKFISISGYMAIFSGFIIASYNTPWPGYISLLPVLGTCFVIYANRQSVVTDHPVVQWFGTSSYSIYLWHWPVVVQLSYLGLFENLAFSILGILLSFALGFCSYKYVEQNTNLKTVFGSIKGNISIVGLVSSSAVLFFIFDGVTGPYRTISLSNQAVFLQDYKHKHENLADAYWLKCNAYKALVDTGTTTIDPSCVKSGESGGVFLWGDSHAEALSFGIRTGLSKNIPFYQVTSAGCKASFSDIAGLRGDIRNACLASNRFAVAKIRTLQPEVVVVAQEGQHDRVDWASFYDELSALGVKHLVLVGPVPQWRPSLPAIYVRRHWGEEEDFIRDNAFDVSLLDVNRAVAAKVNNSNIVYVDILAELCHIKHDELFCRAKIGETLLVVDYGHLSEEGSIYVVEKLLMSRLSDLMVN